MSKRRHNCWRQRRGLTLIEVLAGLALMGGVFAAMLIAHGRFMRQRERAQKREAAIEATDRLLQRWWSEDRPWPVHDTGELAKTNGLRWQIEPRSGGAWGSGGSGGSGGAGGSGARKARLQPLVLTVTDPQADEGNRSRL